MLRSLILAAAVAASPALAGDRLARMGADEVRLMDKPCPYASVLRFIPEAARAEYRKAEGRVQGQRYFACWRDLGDAVHLYWEDGDQGILRADELEDATEA